MRNSCLATTAVCHSCLVTCTSAEQPADVPETHMAGGAAK